MRSSLDSTKRLDPVRLPTFEEMVSPELLAKVDAMKKSVGGDAGLGEAPEVSPFEAEKERVARLCANMRKEALAESERLIEETTRECISIRDKTRRETIKEVRAEFDANSKAAKESVLKAVTALQDAQENLFDELEPYFLEIALHMAESILQFELSREEEAYMSIVRNALSIYRSDGKKRTLYLPPKGYEMLIGADENGPLVQTLADMNVEIVKDKSIAEGDCLVESAIGGVRAGVVTQLSRMRYAASPEKEE